MKKSKNNSEDSSLDIAQQALEERVKKMLDPGEPDPAAPSEPVFKIIKDEPISGESTTAPEINKKDEAELTLPTEISIADDKIPAKELDDEAEKVEAQAGESMLDDAETAKAVDDIVAAESNDLLAAEDEKIAKAFDGQNPSTSVRIKAFLSGWWQNRRARWITIVVLLSAGVAVLAIPASRYFVLNSVGIRSGASLIIVDQSSAQPLKNVSVSLGDQTALTDDNGEVRLNRLKLGLNQLVVEKRAFAVLERPITLGWGSNPLGEMELLPVGSQYSFVVSDFLSNKPLHKVEAISGEASAFSDEKGEIKLTIDKTDNEPVEVSIQFPGYREEKQIIDADDKSSHAVKMVPARKHVFISKRSGTFDVYKIDIDGKNEELVLAGTGRERDDMSVVPHPTAEITALVSSRDDVRNQDGFLLSTLTVIDLSDNQTVRVTRSERVKVVDWIGNRLVYVEIAAGSSAANPKRHRLMSYDYQSGNSKEIATSNYFNSVLVAGSHIYYAPSSLYQTAPVVLYRVNADGSNRRSVLDREAWSISRSEYDKLTVSATGNDWYEYTIGNDKAEKLGGEPSNLRSRLYTNSPDQKRSLWVDQRDGKGVLLIYDIESGEDKELYSRSGLEVPVRWLSDSTVVFRVKTDQETADYALSINGGDPKKIRDVTNTAGIEDWYYY